MAGGVDKMGTDKRTMLCPKCGAENYSWRSRCQTCNTLLHEEDEVSTANYHRRDYLRWSALITGLTGAGTVTFFVWFLGAFAQGRITRLIDWLFVLGTGLFALGGVAIAGKWPLIAGVMLIVEGLVPLGLLVMGEIVVWGIMGDIMGDIQYSFQFSWVLLLFLIPGLSLLASGVLFILIWRKGWRPSKETGS